MIEKMDIARRQGDSRYWSLADNPTALALSAIGVTADKYDVGLELDRE